MAWHLFHPSCVLAALWEPPLWDNAEQIGHFHRVLFFILAVRDSVAVILLHDREFSHQASWVLNKEEQRIEFSDKLQRVNESFHHVFALLCDRLKVSVIVSDSSSQRERAAINRSPQPRGAIDHQFFTDIVRGDIQNIRQHGRVELGVNLNRGDAIPCVFPCCVL